MDPSPAVHATRTRRRRGVGKATEAADGRGDLEEEERVKLLRGLVATEMAEDAAADIATAFVERVVS